MHIFSAAERSWWWQVGFITCSMVMCGLLNMSLLKIAADMASENDEAIFMFECRKFAHQCALTPPLQQSHSDIALIPQRLMPHAACLLVHHV